MFATTGKRDKEQTSQLAPRALSARGRAVLVSPKRHTASGRDVREACGGPAPGTQRGLCILERSPRVENRQSRSEAGVGEGTGTTAIPSGGKEGRGVGDT